MIHLAIVGLGRVFLHYSNYWSKIVAKTVSEVSVVALCDSDSQACYRASLVFPSAKVYTNLDDLFSYENIDVALILTPSGLHYEHCLLCLENNVHVICEKPPTLRIEHLEHLIQLSKDFNLHYSVVFQNRYNPAVQYAKNLIKSNCIGNPRIADISLLWSRDQSYYQDSWHGTWALDGGVICQQAIHHIDASVFLLGEIEAVASYASNLCHKLDAEDTHIGLLKFKNGCLATLKATTALGPVDQQASLSIYGSSGFLRIEGIALNHLKDVMSNGSMLSEELLSSASRDVPSGYGTSHVEFISETLNRIHYSDTTPLVPHEHLSHVLSVIHALYISSYETEELENSLWVSTAPFINFSRLGTANDN